MSSFVPSPPSHGTENCRAYSSAPKKPAKNMTSEKMNHIIPMRNERSTASLYSRLSLSRMTVPNQPTNMNTSSARPAVMTHGPASTWLSHNAPPPTVVNSAIEPTIGHGLPCGT